MIVSVTTLGSRAGDAAGAASRVVQYLDGRGACPGGTHPQPMPDLPVVGDDAGDGAAGIVGYYADSVDGPGRWLGRGVGPVQLSGQIDPEQLRSVLLGQDPLSGDQLVGAQGSAVRAEQAGRDAPEVATSGDPAELLSMAEAASLLDVSARYLRRLAGKTQEMRARQAAQAEAGLAVETTSKSYLDAAQGGSRAHWRVTRAEVARFATERDTPTAVVGYDLTFSVPKSVSILWATADAPRQEEILAAVHHAVEAGIDYLQENAAYVQRAPGPDRDAPRREKAQGLLAASYLHATSRALDPQLHCHVVPANMAERPDGAIRALDGRPLYAHAKTAGYLAAADLRTELSRRLGVEWETVERGVADIAGVPAAAITEMSQRAVAMGRFLENLTENLSQEMGRKWAESPTAHQMAAYETRAAKEHGVDPAALRPAWQHRLDGVGFDRSVADACYERQVALALVTEEDRAKLFEHLASPSGVTEQAAAFDRRDVIQHVAQWSGDRLGTADICDLADAWLTTDVVVRLDTGRRDGRAGDVIRLREGRAITAVDNEALYSTRPMLEVEARIVDSYDQGRSIGAGVVAAETTDAVLAQRRELGADQVEMVQSITSSGHAIQCILGRAGAGKTRALEAAGRAWTDAGYQVMGAAVGGTQAEVLQAATGIESSTVASLITRLQVQAITLTERSIVVVDEASTLPNRDLATLASHCRQAGAALRLAGDPAQHTAVGAGGAWRSLVENHPSDAALLTESRRLQGPEMEEVRLAFEEYRDGHIAAALDRLGRDNRIVEADSPDQLFDTLVADWYVDRLRQAAEPTLAPSSMVTEHHHERRELNVRARALLVADGTLTGPALHVGGVTFQVGDEVIARAKDKTLRPEAGDRRSMVTNGLRGRVVEVRQPTKDSPDPSLVVDFERRGHVVVPHAALTRRVRAGVTGVLAHSYALTSHAAQGETYEAGRHLASERSSRPAVYVGLSRARSAVRLYIVRKSELTPALDAHPELPSLRDEGTLLQAVTARLDAERTERLASEVDPHAREVGRLRSTLSVRQLTARSLSADPSAHLAARALEQELAATASAAQLRPDPALVARLGARPTPGPQRPVWDTAVGAVARYRAQWGPVQPQRSTADAGWALGPRPADLAPAVAYDAAATVLAAAEVAVLSRQPAHDLSAEWKQLTTALAVSPTLSQRDNAATAAGVARQRAQEQTANLVRVEDRLSDLETAPRRRRNPQGIELARREAAAAAQSVANAEAVAANAQDRLDAAQLGVVAQQPAVARRDSLDAALAAKAAAAIAQPAPYLLEALGPRPEVAGDIEAWDAAGMRIESYRHRQLGLEPDDGPAGVGDPIVAAIGEAPPDYALAVQWRAAAVALEEVAMVEVSGPELGIDL